VGLLPPALAAVINNGSTVVAALSSIAPLIRLRGNKTGKAKA
jgi:hypothetical protein